MLLPLEESRPQGAARQLFEDSADRVPAPGAGDLHGQARGHADGIPQAHAVDAGPKGVDVAIRRIGEDAVNLDPRRAHLSHMRQADPPGATSSKPQNPECLTVGNSLRRGHRRRPRRERWTDAGTDGVQQRTGARRCPR